MLSHNKCQIISITFSVQLSKLYCRTIEITILINIITVRAVTICIMKILLILWLNVEFSLTEVILKMCVSTNVTIILVCRKDVLLFVSEREYEIRMIEKCVFVWEKVILFRV